MPSFTFEGFTIGTPVELSVTQGAAMAAGSVSTWGEEATTGTASIDIAASETLTSDTMTMVQHDSARFIATGWADFDTPENHSPSGNIYKPRFHDIIYFWDTGKTGDFTSPVNLLAAHKSRRYAHGPNINIVYEEVGTFALRLYAYEPSSGKFAIKVITINVTSADSTYPGIQTVCINPNGDNDFSGAPAGAVQTNASTFTESHSEWSPGGLKKRYLFKGGASFEFSVDMDRNTVTSGLMFGSYGTGRATLNSNNDTDTFPAIWRDASSPVKRVLVNNLNFDGGHRILQSGGAGDFCSMGSGTHLVISECNIDGFANTCMKLLDGGTDPQGACYFHLNDVVFGPNLSGEYPILTRAFTDPDTTMALTGCQIRRSEQNNYDDTGNRSVARLNAHEWCYIQACDFYNGGNASNTQPTLKLAEQGDRVGGTYNVHCNSIESGGGPAMFFKHNRSEGVHANLICRQNRFAAVTTGTSFYEIISIRGQGTSIDSNIIEVLGTANGFTGQTRAAIFFRADSVASTNSPNYVRNNTIVNHKSQTENDSPNYDAVLYTGQTAGWDVTEGSNIDHQIGRASTPDAPLAHNNALYAYRNIGRRTGGSFNTGYAASPAQAHSWRPEAGSSALGDAGAVYHPVPYDGQTEHDMRPPGAEDRGAWQGSA